MRLFHNHKKVLERKQPDIFLQKRIHEELIYAIRVHRVHHKKGLTIEELAKYLNTNREYLSQVINKKHGTFSEYINKHRIMDAIELISNTEYKFTIAIIANEVGFNSISSFISAYKRVTGVTPSEFKKISKKSWR